MRNTGYVYDPVFLKHTQAGHPENAQRLEVILKELNGSGLLASLRQIPARAATAEEITAVHPVSRIKRVREISRAGGGYLDPDTYTTPATYDAAVTAAGSVTALTLGVIDGTIANGFALVRPPGHHATSRRAMGFCIFNNVAIAAKAAQIQRGLERIAIVDFDVHHGNGTQDIFEDDSAVLYISSHQYPHYPGTGSVEEIGRGAGKGGLLNIPLSSGMGDDAVKALYTEVLTPVLRRFQPRLILVSAGYDCHWNDPLASLGLSLEGITWISHTLVDLAEELCSGRIVFALEGGYSPAVLSLGVANSFRALLAQRDVVDPFGPSPRREPDAAELLVRLKQFHGIRTAGS
ncbi:MAG: histone deacetylase [bacterium]|nr:histone deacetylase [bacterium]